MTDFQHKTGSKVADAIRHSWVYLLPQWVWPYAQLARWERPIGWQLLMWPCWWSLALALNYLHRQPSMSAEVSDAISPFGIVWFMLLFWAGAFLMRGAGCTYNDLVDQDIDDKVARTRSRPLPSGRVTKRGALVFLLLQLLGGLLILLQFNQTVIWLGVASLVTVLVYPFMKRVTWWPQLFLGFAFSWGALVGWWSLMGLANTTGPMLWAVPVILYIGSICWVIGYDTIYAHQDIEDDALVGVKSTARLFGENTPQALILLFSAAMTCFAVAIYLSNAGWIAWAGYLAGAAHMVWQLRSLDIHDPAHCLKLFKANSHFGFILFAGLLLGVPA
jgi:4-hydroxybenzoate polyprenyltransferase